MAVWGRSDGCISSSRSNGSVSEAPSTGSSDSSQCSSCDRISLMLAWHTAQCSTSTGACWGGGGSLGGVRPGHQCTRGVRARHLTIVPAPVCVPEPEGRSSSCSEGVCAQGDWGSRCKALAGKGCQALVGHVVLLLAGVACARDLLVCPGGCVWLEPTPAANSAAVSPLAPGPVLPVWFATKCAAHPADPGALGSIAAALPPPCILVVSSPLRRQDQVRLPPQRRLEHRRGTGR